MKKSLPTQDQSYGVKKNCFFFFYTNEIPFVKQNKVKKKIPFETSIKKFEKEEKRETFHK